MCKCLIPYFNNLLFFAFNNINSNIYSLIKSFFFTFHHYSISFILKVNNEVFIIVMSVYRHTLVIVGFFLSYYFHFPLSFYSHSLIFIFLHRCVLDFIIKQKQKSIHSTHTLLLYVILHLYVQYINILK